MTSWTHNTATEAVARARSSSTWLPKGMCMQFSWDALSSRTRWYGLPDANAGWTRTTLRRYDRTPPPGAPVYWSGYEHGHVAISVGGGRVRSTDCPTNGVVSELSLAAVEKRWPGLTYLGYGLDLAGDRIPGLAPDPTPTPTPTPEKEDDDMPLTTEDVEKIAARTRDLILWAPTFPKGTGLGGSSVRNNLGIGAGSSVQTLAIVRQLAARAQVDVDEQALAQQLLASLTPALTDAVEQALASWPAEAQPDPAQFAADLVDELARRLASPAEAPQ